MTTTNDEFIVQQILNGKSHLYKILVERYQNIIFSLGMRFFKNYDEAQDYTQEVFIKVYNHLDSFKNKSTFKSWLCKVAYNHAINKLETLKTNASEEYTDNVENKLDPEKIAINSEIQSLLEQAIENLPDNYKACIDLYFYAGLSIKEISTITGFPINTIKSYIFRAKQHLRDALKNTIAEDYYEM